MSWRGRRCCRAPRTGAACAGAGPRCARSRARRRDREAPVKIDAVADRCQDILAALGQVVVGKADVLQQHPRRHPRQRPHPHRGLPGPGQDAHRPAPRPDARSRLQAHPVHARSPAQRHHRQLPLRPARGAVRVPPRPDLHQPAPRRRDQPRHAQDAERAARGDAGGAGHRRGRALPARAAVPRDRHAEPDRARGHLPAARGAARPLPDAPGASGYPDPEEEVRDPRPPARAGARTRSHVAAVISRAELLAMQASARGRPRGAP